jgi:hypothetical protein
MRMGEAFHRAIQRAEVGIPPELILAQLQDPLDSWFTSYLKFRPQDLPDQVTEVESVLSTPLQLDTDGSTFRLAAKYDLLAVEPGKRAIIMDWKTSRRRPEAHQMRQRLQSQIYPYLVVEASSALPWGPLKPEQVEMRYWFTAAPDEPIRLQYDTAQHKAVHQLLQRLIAQIVAGEGEADFAKLPDTEANRARFCAYCTYRSRCDRGIYPGDVDKVDDVVDLIQMPEADLEINLDDLPELAF